MSGQWFYVLAVVAVSGIFFLMGSAERAAYIGWLSLACAVLFMGYVASTGIRARRLREGKPEEPDAVDVHRIHVAILTTFILVGVVGMEIAVRKVGGLWGDPALVALHFVLVGLTTATYLLARFYLTGLYAPRRHRYVVYPFITFFIATFTTGTMLLWKQFLSP